MQARQVQLKVLLNKPDISTGEATDSIFCVVSVSPVPALVMLFWKYPLLK